MNAMAAYIVLLLINLIASLATRGVKNGNGVYFWISVIQLTLLSGLRGLEVGTDTLSYYNIFIEISKIDNIGLLFERREEIGYVLLNRVISLFGGNISVLLTICAFITAYGLMRFLRDNTVNLRFSTYLLITFMFFFTSMNVVRQYMATAIGLNAITCVKKKKYLKGIMFILIGALFHKLAPLYLVIYFAYCASVNKQVRIIFYVSIGICLVWGKQILIKAAEFLGYETYIQSFSPDDGIMNIIMYSSIAIFIIVAIIQNKKILSQYGFDLLMFAIVLSLAIFGKVHFIWANRVAWLFSPIVLVLIPNVISSISPSYKRLCSILIQGATFCYFTYCLSFGWQGITPYSII